MGESGSSAALSLSKRGKSCCEVPRLHTRCTGTHRMRAKLTLHDTAALPTERRPPCRRLRRLRRAKPRPPEERPLRLQPRQPRGPPTAPVPSARGYPHAIAARCADSSANRSRRREVVRGVKRPESFAARRPPSGKRRRRGVGNASKRQSECFHLDSYSLEAGLTPLHLGGRATFGAADPDAPDFMGASNTPWLPLPNPSHLSNGMVAPSMSPTDSEQRMIGRELDSALVAHLLDCAFFSCGDGLHALRESTDTGYSCERSVSSSSAVLVADRHARAITATV